MGTSEAQKKASKKWREANRSKDNRITKKSAAKNYISTSNEVEFEEIKVWVAEREKQIKN